MLLTISDKDQLRKAFNAFANHSFKNGKIEYELEDKPFQNLYGVLYKIPEIKEIFDFDILMYGVEKAITSRFTKTPIEFKKEEIENLIIELISTLEHNLADHLIIVPLQDAQFDEVIRIENLILIPANFERKEKLKIISRAAKKKLADTNWIAEHTENSRSNDFFKHPLLLIKQKHHTYTVHYNSLNMAKIVIYAIRCFYYGRIHNTPEDKPIFNLWKPHNLSKASHLAIYSREDWRQNHKPLDFDVNLSFNLEWLRNKTAKEFKIFLNQIYFKGSLDDFNTTFLNGLILYNESIKHDTSISTIITIIIAESILTQNKNEKRLRIAAILPRLLNLEEREQKNISKKFNELYKKRNKFVHSGESVSIDYHFETQEPTILDKGRKVIAELILNYPYFEKILNKKIPSNEATNEKTRMKYWKQYTDTIFQDVLF